MNGQNTPVAENAPALNATNAPVAAPAVQGQVASAKVDTLVVYKIVNGERAGEEVILVPSADGVQYVASTAKEPTPSAKHVRLELEASGYVFTIVAIAVLVFLGYSLSVLRSIMLGEFHWHSDSDDAATSASRGSGRAPAASAATPVAATAPAAAPVAAELHPGMPNEKLAAILGVAAAEALGPNVQVVKFRSMNQSDWTWAVQGRSNLHSNRLV